MAAGTLLRNNQVNKHFAMKTETSQWDYSKDGDETGSHCVLKEMPELTWRRGVGRSDHRQARQQDSDRKQAPAS